MIALLLACAEPSWTHAGALAGAFARVDVDQDGAISQAEYARVAWNAPAFDRADADRSGGVDIAELDALTRAQDPVTVFEQGTGHGSGRSLVGPPGDGRAPTGGRGMPPGAPGMGGMPPGAPGMGAPGMGGPGMGAPGMGGAQQTPKPPKPIADRGEAWIVLLLLRDEVLARDPAAVVPTDEEIAAADAAGGLTDPAAAALLGHLHAEATRLGLGFPASLAPRP